MAALRRHIVSVAAYRPARLREVIRIFRERRAAFDEDDLADPDVLKLHFKPVFVDTSGRSYATCMHCAADSQSRPPENWASMPPADRLALASRNSWLSDDRFLSHMSHCSEAPEYIRTKAQDLFYKSFSDDESLTGALKHRPIVTSLHFLVLAFLTIFCWVFVTPDSYAFTWAKAKLFTPEPLDPRMWEHCTPVDPNLDPLAMVVPMVHKQVPRFRSAVARWVDNPPCTGEDPPSIDLVLYLDIPWEFSNITRSAKAATIETLRQPEVQKLVTKCFRNVIFSSAMLTPEESRNSNVEMLSVALRSTRGSNRQFREMIRNERMQSSYNYAFLNEPDAFPIRPFWLDEMSARIRGHLSNRNSAPWVMGSLKRYPNRFLSGIEPYRTMFQQHLNGNSFYRLGDPCFERFLDGVEETYGDGAYDVAMTYYLRTAAHSELYQNVGHRFLPTNFIANVGSVALTENQLRANHEGTYIVHGKNSLELVSRTSRSALQ